jgi:hypothetical protein
MSRMINYIDLNWKTEEKFNIGSKYQPPVTSLQHCRQHWHFVNYQDIIV